MNALRYAVSGLLALSCNAAGATEVRIDGTRVPLIVELFTSQSCSSCPPAEDLAERLVREQPLDGYEIIVLAEHVDYWDHLSWKDPYSSEDWTRRQSAYAKLLSRRDSVYTPQAVIDGHNGVVGSDDGAIMAALRTAAGRQRGRLQISAQRHGDDAVVMIEQASAPLPKGYEYWAALVQDGIATHVPSGENSGATLRENGVLRGLQKLSTRATPIKLPKDAGTAPYRVVVFAQNAGDGSIAAAGQARLSP